MLFVVRALAESNLVVFLVVFEPVLLPRHGGTWVFFLDTVAILIVVVAFGVARRIIPIIVRLEPRVNAFIEFLKNPLTGLAMQSLVFWVVFQLMLQVFIARNLAGFVPHLSGVVVGDVPQFRCAPPMQVERLYNLRVVADFRPVSSMGFVERLYKGL